MTVGVDASGRSAQRSFTVHGGEQFVASRQAELVEAYGVRRALPGWQGERVTLGALLVQFVEAPHVWSPTTWVSHESVVRALRRDRLSGCRVDRLTPSVLQRAIMRWGATGASVAVISGRFLVLRSAITWAMAERMLRRDPLVGMKSPPRPYPRKHLRPDLVRELMATAEQRREKAEAALVEHPRSRAAELRLFRAEQDVLLVSLTADTGARRGELAALRVDDLDGRELTIERARKGSIIGSTKTYRRGRITVGKTVAVLWAEHVAAWRSHPLAGAIPGPWLFTARPDRQVPISPSGLTQRFDKIADAAGLPEACLHRLRHSVGTFLVGEGKILKAAGRLRHHDPSTTLRNYADALPLDDEDVADALDHLYHDPRD